MRVERWRPTMCKECKRRETRYVKISARGLCTRCAVNRVGDSHEQMRQHEGPVAEKWARNYARGVARFLQESSG